MVSLGAPNPPVRRPRPNNGVAFTTPSRSDYRSTCTVCRLGIFTGDDTVWGCGRLMGLMHAACARQAGATVVAEPLRPTEPKDAPAASARVQIADLTDRQLEMVRLKAERLSDAQIGERLGVSARTVGNILRAARDRLGANTTADTVALARSRGLIRTTKES